MAAVLAEGPSAVLSHRSAAALWGLRGAAHGRIDVTVPKARRSRAGLQVRQALLAADEVTIVGAMPVTTPPRTLLDLAGVVGRRALERAVDEAEVLRLADELSLADLLVRHPGRRGVSAIRRLLEAGRIGAGVTRSELEERFLVFLQSGGLPLPEVNAALSLAGGWIEADCLWRSQRVIVELDGYASHGTRSAFERDRARDRMLQAAGWRVLRVTWRQLHEQPGAIAAELGTLLSSPRAPRCGQFAT